MSEPAEPIIRADKIDYVNSQSHKGLATDGSALTVCRWA